MLDNEDVTDYLRENDVTNNVSYVAQKNQLDHLQLKAKRLSC